MSLLITVLLPTYNGEKYIRQAIASVLNQTHASLELIIIDDASTDNTVRVVQEVTDHRIRLVRNEVNIGLTKSLNLGISLSGGTFIARIDDDDAWTDTAKLARQVDFLQAHPEVDLLGTAAQLVTAGGEPIRTVVYPVTDRELRMRMLQRNQFVHSSVLLRGSTVRKLGGYNERLKSSQDYELWLRIGRQGKVANLPDSMVAVRQRAGAVSHQHHYQQFWSFAQSAYQYRHDYPGYYYYLPSYLLEASLNSMPYSWRARLRNLFNQRL